jgi:hypothetical protein
MPDIVQKNFSNTAQKDVQYLNKDFGTLKNALINYSKTYFPKTYKDFSDSSPGMMYIEQAAYVGDVLSYYTDYQFKEGLMPYAQELPNVIALAKMLGYTPSTTKAAITTLNVFQLVPAILDSTSGNYVPDTTYCLNIREYMAVKNSNNITYITTESLDFSVNTGLSPRTDTVYSRDQYGVPTFFLLQKSINAISGEIVTRTFTITNPIPFYQLVLPENNVIQILNVVDSDNNKWYEADYLAQDLVFTELDNTYVNDGEYYTYQTEVPKLIKSLKTSRKFTVNVDSTYSTYLEFGAGIDAYSNEVIYPTADLVGVGLQNIEKLGISLDSSTFLKLGGYGQAPSNTVLTVTYIVGGGISSNCPVGDIVTVSSVSFSNNISALNPSQQTLFQTVQNSLQVTNVEPATGGFGQETIDQIRQNALANFVNQDRAVTEDDYISRVYSMPPRFGSITKVCMKSDSKLNINNINNGFVNYNNVATLTQQAANNYYRKISYDSSNPFGLNLYVLSYNNNGHLTTLNTPTIQNLRQYLAKYKMLNDGINIIDGYIINIKVNFQILTYSNYNKQDVLNNCISNVQDFFNIDKWYFNMPINIGQLQLTIAKVEGVQSVTKLQMTNLTINDGNYSPYEYNLDQAPMNNIIYPSLDPSVFEVKYPDNDIVGSVL